MWDYKMLGVSVYYILNWFYIYSFLGWLWESCYVSVKSKKMVNRGFINGPLCTIYGCGALGVYLILRPFGENILVLYAGGMVVATVLEYITGYLMETIFHTRWWDYSKNKCNLHGRICLNSSLGWGVLTVLLFKVLHPFAERVVSLYSITTGKLIVVVVTVLYGVDFITSAVAAYGLPQKFKRVDEMLNDLTSYLQTTKLFETKEEIRERLEESRQAASFRLARLHFQKQKEEWSNRLFEKNRESDGNWEELKLEFERRFDDFTDRLSVLHKKEGLVTKRMRLAYPNLLKEYKKYQEKKEKKENKNH